MARVNLGVMYLNGRGVLKDVARAKELFRQAADPGGTGGGNVRECPGVFRDGGSAEL